MIIKNVIIENFLCYYNTNTLNFTNGLNIILGENGEGKTKFIEAIEWLFNGGQSDLESLISKKKLHETDNGEQLKVSVTMEVEQFGEINILRRSFKAKKINRTEVQISNSSFEGIEENKKGERSQVDGNRLIMHLFPSEIRKYSIFKGETELNIFDNEDALINLVDLFSDAKYYNKYTITGAVLLENAEDAISKASKLKAKNNKEYEKLESNISVVNKEIDDLKSELFDTEEEIDKTQELIKDAHKYIQNAEDLDIINKRIETLENEERKSNSYLKEEYTTYLFDNKWILKGFKPIFDEYQKKVSDIGIKKRRMQSEFDKEVGRKQGALKAVSDLLGDDKVPLEFNVPDKATMQELIKDEFCKVCGRPAKKGSDAYNYMVNRLNEYVKRQEPVDEKEETLFTGDYISGLINLSNSHSDNLKGINNIDNEIKELLSFNKKRKEEVNNLQIKITEEKVKRIDIIGKSTIGEEKLINVLNNYNNWQKRVGEKDKEKNKIELEFENKRSLLEKLEIEKNKIDIGNVQDFLIKSRDVIKDINEIFKDTKESKFDEFIRMLEIKSNEYFKKINQGAFTGRICLIKNISSSTTKLRVELYEGEDVFLSPNTSLETSMHISILFAISEIAKEYAEESYPLIFDAPTSSFGETKTGAFLNIIASSKNQIILLTKDFLGEEPKKSGNIIIKPEFDNIKRKNALWVKLERPFDNNRLETINTNVIQL